MVLWVGMKYIGRKPFRSPCIPFKPMKRAVFQEEEHLTSLILSAKVQIYLSKAVFKVTLIRELPTVRAIMIIQSINQWKIMPVTD